MITDDKLKAARQPAPAWTEEAATTPQVGYITSLVEDREVPEKWLLRIKELYEQEGGLKKGEASRIISSLKGLPFKAMRDDRSINAPKITDLPVGRYAIHPKDDEEDISFYRVKDVRGGPEKEGGYRFIAQIAGPNEYPLKGQHAKDVIKQIVRFGIGDAAALYGHKVKKCSKCHTRITNRVSRRLGIGPVCGGRYYDDWQERVNKARTDLRAAGLDPDENVEEDDG